MEDCIVGRLLDYGVGFKAVRFRGRYYFHKNSALHWWGPINDPAGSNELYYKIIAEIPPDPVKYQEWLGSMRAQYAAQETDLETSVYEIHDSAAFYIPRGMFVDFPSDLPLDLKQVEMRAVERPRSLVYIINLDQEVLTMGYGIHWKLANIPRDDSWSSFVQHSIYPKKPTVDLRLCPGEHVASLALELPEPNPTIGYEHCFVTPKRDITETRQVFLTYALAKSFIEYKETITNHGREFSPDSFPFRELAFALISIASGQAEFYSFPTKMCLDRTTCGRHCLKTRKHLVTLIGDIWLDEYRVGDKAPLPFFGSMFHFPGQAPGVSPAETMYWFEGVLISLVLVIDGEAITKAVAWGIEQGRTNFRIVVLTLFQVAFAEVSFGDNEKPFVRVSEAAYLSPLREEYCLSTHPRERPVFTGEDVHQRGELIIRADCTATRRRLRSQFPGLATLVDFFETATNPRAVSGRLSVLSREILDLIIDLVDYDTWKACLAVSMELRYSCFRRYKLNDRTRLVAGPLVRQGPDKRPLLSFNFQDVQTGKTTPMVQTRSFVRPEEDVTFLPLIGQKRRALMLNVPIQFEAAEDMVVQPDEDDGWPQTLLEKYHRVV
ncbi:hypothetical protein F5Y10DRAFT_293500 [Nemania abortiva]|nr:hypothetical protein F5Y10DRAFT_293500 [Nemania abortiva]